MVSSVVLVALMVFSVLVCPTSTLLAQDPTNNTSLSSYLQQELTLLKKTTVQLQTDLSSAKQEITFVKGQLNSPSSHHVEVEIQAVKDELFAVKSELQTSTSKLFAVASELKTLKDDHTGQMATASEQIQNLTSKVTSCASTLSSLQTEVAATKTALTSLTPGVSCNTTNLQANLTENIGFSVSSHYGDTGTDHRASYQIEKDEVLKFSRVSINFGHALDVTSGVVTAPVTGVYLFWAQIYMFDLSFQVRLVRIPSLEVILESDASSSHATFSIPVYLQKGQQVALVLSSYDNVYKDTHPSRFSGFLVEEL